MEAPLDSRAPLHERELAPGDCPVRDIQAQCPHDSLGDHHGERSLPMLPAWSNISCAPDLFLAGRVGLSAADHGPAIEYPPR